MEQEPTTKDVIEVINAFSTKMDGRMDKLDGRMDKLEKDVGYLKSNMITKDGLDEALAKQKGEIVMTMRKEDVKLREVVSILSENKVLTPAQVQHIVSMEPFAQLSV